MASVTKENPENSADASDDDSRDDDVKSSKPAKGKSRPEKDEVRALDVARRTGPRPGGLFTIYKKGQGYWTRMGTLLGVTLLGVLLAYTLYAEAPANFIKDRPTAVRVGIGLGTGFLVIYGIVALWLMNKPSNVDFLIATDSEMKKVNWTSRKELIGSSKVVIIFMFLIALYLFVNDIVFGYLMYAIKVLRTPPLG
jgi:preprotein translocase SecE subunit